MSALKKIITGAIFLMYTVSLTAQDAVLSVLDATIDSLEERTIYNPVDSTYMQEIEELLDREEKIEDAKRVIKVTERTLLEKEMSFSPDGILSILRGGITFLSEDKFSKHPGIYRKYSRDISDYGVASAPLAASWILKAAGLESRSTTKRMLLSNAMALAISSSIVKGLKLAIDAPRPDKSGDDSFPSGHSSLAFVGATILHREFGHHTPWLSVGGYAAATATQYLRLEHNKHWPHETFIGAGIGVVSTNLAYFITDKILGEKGINSPRFTYSDMQRVLKYNTTPSSFSFVSGSEMGSRTINQEYIELPSDFTGKAKINIGAGFMAGIEGSWFINTNVAFDAILKLTTSKANLALSGTPWQQTPMYVSDLDSYRFSLGVRYSYPIAMAHRFSFRLFAGARTINDVNFGNADDGAIMFRLPGETKFDSGASIMYDCINTKKYSFGFNVDYHHTNSEIMPHRYGLSTVWKILL